MRLKQKLAYMTLGGLLVFAGQLLPGVLGDRATAQDNPTSAVFDFGVFKEVSCRGLKILDAQGDTVALLKGDPAGQSKSVVLQVFDGRGQAVARIGSDANGGYVSVYASNGNASASLGIGGREKDGRVSVTDSAGKARAQMIVDRYGARVVSR